MRHCSVASLSIVFLVALVSAGVGEASEDRCAKSNLYSCPSDACNGTILVSDCLDCDGNLNTDTANDACFDRKLLNGKDNPSRAYLWRDLIGMVFWFCAAGVATSCGVGGGGIYVPLGILLLNFAPKQSSGLSQASIFGASVGGLLLNLRNKHPFAAKVERGVQQDGSDACTSIPNAGELPVDTDAVKYYGRPLIDYDMALFLAPMEMAGAVLGVLIQKILPNWLYLSMAATILGFTSHKTYKKYVAAHKKEAEAKETTEAAQQIEAEQNSPAKISPMEKHSIDQTIEISSNEEVSREDEEYSSWEVTSDVETVGEPVATEGPKNDEEPAVTDDVVIDDDKIARRNFLLEQDARQIPTEKLGALFVLWIGLILLTFFKGGKGVDSIVGITCESPWYGILIGIQFTWTLGFASVYGYKITKATEEKKTLGYPFHPHDVLWDFPKTRFYAFFTLVAGVVAGLIGIGGGMVLGPLMLVMGIHPRVSTATTATMVVLTSSSVAVLFVTAGLVPWQYAVCFFCICFGGALVGKTKIDGYVKKTERASILIFLLATIIAFATLGCVVIVLLRLAAADWCFAGFNKFCNLSSDETEEILCPVDRMLFHEYGH